MDPAGRGEELPLDEPASPRGRSPEPRFSIERPAGTWLGAYRILWPLRQGGTGVVYEAEAPDRDEHVAVKVLTRRLDDPATARRFDREVRLISGFRHPNILWVHDDAEADGHRFLAMPLVAWGSLADRLEGEPMPAAEVQRIVAEIASALDFAHRRGVVHRDLKPANVLVDEDGTCLLADFGLAKGPSTTTRLTVSGDVFGTPLYMSPEQAMGLEVNRGTDVYALGILAFELLTGSVPYVGDTPVAVCIAHLGEPIPSACDRNPDLPRAIGPVLRKAMAKVPGRRAAAGGRPRDRGGRARVPVDRAGPGGLHRVARGPSLRAHRSPRRDRGPLLGRGDDRSLPRARGPDPLDLRVPRARRIRFDPHRERYVLEDLESANGTEVDGTPVRRPEPLGRLHVIRVAGRFDLIFQDLRRP